MSCFKSNCYLPQPPRAWSRVQNSCSLITDSDNNSLVRDPYTGQLVTTVVLGERIAMLNKGNVLQYKANSSNLTKAQRYSKIAKGQWVNRNTTWATQSTRGYTNPNTTSLKRSGNVVNIAIDPITGAIIGPTFASPTCPQPITTINEVLPSNGGGGSDVIEPQIPPPIPPTPGSDIFPSIISDIPVEPIVIQDGGNLICSVQENICTGEIKSTLAQQLCHPTTDSDVPGPIQELCWNDGIQTWYPRQRYIMTNSANKWPVNAELLSAIQIYAPYITSITSNREIVTIVWDFNNSCLPATNFNIYQNDILVKSVNGNTFTTDLIVNNCNYYQYYIVSVNITANTISEPSNLVGINISYIEPPTNLSYTTIGSGTIELYWGLPNPNCNPPVSYNIYSNLGTLIGNTTNLFFTISGLTVCNNYSYYVKALSSINTESEPSNTISFQLLWPGPPVSLFISTYLPNGNTINAVLSWNAPLINTCTNPYITYNLYLNSVLVASNISGLTYTYTGLDYYTSYTYGVQSSAIINGSTALSSIVSITDTTLPPFSTPGVATINYTSGFFNILFETVGSTSITFYPNIQQLSVLISGGGGGGSGTPATALTYQLWGSGGGAGGQAFLIYKDTDTNEIFNLTVGSGGLGNNSANGSPGSSSSFETFIVGGGQGGYYGSNSNTQPAFSNSGGLGGSYPSIDSIVFASGSGGRGGRGGQSPQPLPVGGSWPFPTTYYAGQGDNSFIEINNILIPNMSINVGGGGGGAAIQGGTGGNGFGGTPENSGITNFDGQTYGAGGGAYNNSYGGGNAGNGHDGLVAIKFRWPNILFPFSFTGAYIKEYISPYYYLIISTSGTLTLTQIVYNSYIVCVGGGGGGGGGNTSESVGAGGGGGGAAVINVGILSSGSYNITVGTGGAGGAGSAGSAGGSSGFDTYIFSTGGGGGSRRGPPDGTTPGGIAGTVTTSYPIVSSGTGQGGKGGYGIYGIDYVGENGYSSDIYNGGLGYTLPTGNNIIFSGGGGGSKDGSSSYGSGGGAGQGYGGQSGWSQQVSWPEQQAGLSSTYQYPLFGSLEEVGESAQMYGSGGGGGGGNNRGGNGGNGLIMVLFTLNP